MAHETVLASQRGRVLEAMLVVSAERGFRATTVAAVVARARVSRRTFYQYFDSLEECFVAAMDALTLSIQNEVAALVADTPADDWLAWMDRWIESYLMVLEAEPMFTRSLIVESLSAGPLAQRQRARTATGFAVLTNRIVAAIAGANPQVRQVHDYDVAFFLGGARELILNRLLEEPDELVLLDLAPHLRRLSLLLLGLPAGATDTRSRDGCATGRGWVPSST